MRDIQRDVESWTKQFEPQYWPPYEILARMSEEVGELAREINHIYGTKKKKANEANKELGSELCDIIFTVACMANSHDIDLQDEWDRMFKEKMHSRDKERYQKRQTSVSDE